MGGNSVTPHVKPAIAFKMRLYRGKVLVGTKAHRALKAKYVFNKNTHVFC